MLGRDHALLGCLGYLGGAALVAHAEHVPVMQPVQLGIGAVTCAGFALLPDIDEQHSVIANKLGPISRVVSSFTHSVAGGHRQATHSLLFTLAVGAAMVPAAHTRIGAAIVVFCAWALALRLILPKTIRGSGIAVNLLIPAGVGYYVYYFRYNGTWLAIAAGAGVLLHLLGDFMTKEGVPFLWGVTKRHFAVPVLGHTNSVREQVSRVLMGLGILVLLGVFVAQPMYLDIVHHHPLNPAVHLPALKTGASQVLHHLGG